MKAYRGVDGRIRVFRPNMNMNRMNLTAHRSGLPTFDGEQMIQCMNRLISIDQEWVPHTNAASLYIRPTMIGIDVIHIIVDGKNICLKRIGVCPLPAHTRRCFLRFRIALRHSQSCWRLLPHIGERSCVSVSRSAIHKVCIVYSASLYNFENSKLQSKTFSNL